MIAEESSWRLRSSWLGPSTHILMCKLIHGFEVWLLPCWNYFDISCFVFYYCFSALTTHLMTSHDHISYLYLYPLRFTTLFSFWLQLDYSIFTRLSIFYVPSFPLRAFMSYQALLTYHVIFLCVCSPAFGTFVDTIDFYRRFPGEDFWLNIGWAADSWLKYQSQLFNLNYYLFGFHAHQH